MKRPDDTPRTIGRSAPGTPPAAQPPLPRRQFLSRLVAALGGGALLGTARPARAATMAGTPLIGELMLFCGNFAPMGWLFCDGSLVPISQYEALFFVIGTTYGGDGQSTFGLPDLRGRVPIHAGQGAGLSSRMLGELGGAEQVTLLQGQLPAHGHTAMCAAAAGTSDTPTGLLPARDGAGTLGWNSTPSVPMSAAHLGLAGSSQPHENRMPCQAINFCIAAEGIFPTQ